MFPDQDNLYSTVQHDSDVQLQIHQTSVPIWANSPNVWRVVATNTNSSLQFHKEAEVSELKI